MNVQERIELGQKDRPVDELLAAYAAGSLSAPLMALIAAHLELKPARRAFVAALEAAYGILLEDIEPVPLTNRDRRLVDIFAREQDQPVAPIARALNGHRQNGQRYNGHADHDTGVGQGDQIRNRDQSKEQPNQSNILPSSLRDFIGQDFEKLEWRSTASGIKQSVVTTGAGGEGILMRFRAGKRTPAHSHQGLEVMLVLQGGFGDGYGQYRRGDVCVADETVEHQPIADPGEDCIVFAVRAAPMKFVGTMDRMMQLFLGRSV